MTQRCILGVIGAMLLATAIVSCNNGPSKEDIEKARQDSIRKMDSITQVAIQQAKEDSIKKAKAESDSISEARNHPQPGKWVVTGNNVCVRTGPSKSAPKMPSYYEDMGYMHMDKGDIVILDGRAENGYAHCKEYIHGDFQGLWEKEYGWISQDYLRKK